MQVELDEFRIFFSDPPPDEDLPAAAESAEPPPPPKPTLSAALRKLKSAGTAVVMANVVTAAANATRYGMLGLSDGATSSLLASAICSQKGAPVGVLTVHVPAAAPAAGARPPVSAAGSPLGLLEKQYGRQVSVVQTAAEVVSRATVIFIDLPPHLAEQALRDLGGFTEAQTVVCLTPHIGLPLLHACCAPIPPAQLVRALPLPPWAEPAAAKGQAPTKRAALAAMVLDAEGQPAPLPPLLAALLAAAQRRLDRLGRLGRQLGPRHEP